LVEGRFRVEMKRKALRAADYGETDMGRQAELFPGIGQKEACRRGPTRRMLPVRAGVNPALASYPQYVVLALT